MKLTNTQLDTLASVIRKRLVSSRDLEQEKRDYVDQLFEEFKRTEMYKKTNEILKNNFLIGVVLDPKEFFKELNIKDYYRYFSTTVNKECIDEDIKQMINNTYKNNIPTRDEIRERLVLESSAPNEGETTEDIINRMVEVFMF